MRFRRRKTVYLVYKGTTSNIVGVFTTEEKALDACVDIDCAYYKLELDDCYYF